MAKTIISQQDREKCAQGYSKLCEVMPGGVGSPTRAFKYVDEAPMVVARGKADKIYDVDGNRYVDFHMSWGALIHGHAHPRIIEGITRVAEDGTTFGMSCMHEEKLARKLITNVPSVEQVRFLSSGTEAAMTALRLARGYTKRDYIIKFTGCFHGHADFLLVQGGSAMVGNTPTSSSLGVPQDFIKYTLCLPFNDVEATRKVLRSAEYRDKIAAVIVEPIAGNMGVVPAKQEFLDMLRKETTQCGALLIFDEVITGFRVALGGAQELYGITPDLTCFGKVVAGGMPAAAFGGPKKIMEALAPKGGVYQAGTLSGNPVSMEAGIQTLRLLEVDGTYDELERKARLLLDPIEERLKAKSAPACVQRVGSMFTLFFGTTEMTCMEDAPKLDDKIFRRFFSYVFARGVFLPPAQYESSFISTVHTDKHLEYARDVILDFIDATY